MKFLDGYAASLQAIQEANAARAFTANPGLEARVAEICEAVRLKGDEAILENVRRFDCPDLTLEQLKVTPEEMEEAWQQVPPTALAALEHAARNIEEFHRHQPRGDWSYTTPDGTVLGQRYTPIERVGMYAPNGRAAYPSTVLMLAVPARVAGVSQRVLATPAGQDGKAHPVILAAARIAGITEVYKVGGAAAVAAFAYGTDTIPAVDKVVGPGSIYLTLAKKHLYGVVGIDGLYGPSEVAILAEEAALDNALAGQLAADLIAQAEHGADSFVAFVSPSKPLCRAVTEEVERQVQASSRSATLAESLQNSLVCCVESMEQACDLCDTIAAEHVEIWATEAHYWGSRIRNAGALFLNSPVPLGDYIAGPSHTLPTGATARFASGVAVDTFLKRSTMVQASRAGVRAVAPDLERIALLEDLPGHAAAVNCMTG